jgi:hypothetical protein
MAELTRWEYRCQSVGSVWSRPKDEVVEDMLNNWGEEGWEVVGLWRNPINLPLWLAVP